MNINRISQCYNSVPSMKGTGDTNSPVQRDSFSKSDPLPEIGGISQELASKILFAGKNNDLFNLKANNFDAFSATYNPETGGYYAGLVHGSGSDKKNYLASFNPDGSIKWKALTDTPVYGLIPDKKGGVVARLFNRIYRYDNDGNKSWEFELPDTDHSFNNLPMISSDNTVYYPTGNLKNKNGKSMLSIAAVKDGKLLWNYDIENYPSMAVNFMVTKSGNTLFTSEGKRKPGSETKTIYSDKEKMYYLTCLNPDGTKKFEREVVHLAHTKEAIVEGKDGDIFYLSDFPGQLNSITPEGESKWTFEHDHFSHPPVVDGKGNIYVTTGSDKIFDNKAESSVICIDEKTGEKKWEQKFDRGIEESPIISGDSIFIKVTKKADGQSEPGFIKMDEKGNVLDTLRIRGKGGYGFTYLDKDYIATRTDKSFTVTHFDPLTGMHRESMDKAEEAIAADTGKIELKQNSVIIGGVELKKGK